MATVCNPIGAAAPTNFQQDVVGLRRDISLKRSLSAPNSVAVGAAGTGRSNHGVRASQVQDRPPVRPAVSFPLFPRNMEAYSGVSGQTTTVPVAPFLDQELEVVEAQKKRRVPIPALNIVMRSDLGVIMERRW